MSDKEENEVWVFMAGISLEGALRFVSLDVSLLQVNTPRSASLAPEQGTPLDSLCQDFLVLFSQKCGLGMTTASLSEQEPHRDLLCFVQ